MVESSRIKKVKKFDFVIEDGKHIHLTEEQINQQKKNEEEAKAEAAKRESEVRKEELIDLLGPEVVNKYYNDKLQYDRYYDKMLNRRAVSRITNCDVLTREGPITLKVYRGDGTSEIVPNFKDIPQSKQDPLDKFNDLANKKRKHADDIHDYFKANKRLKSSVQYEDHLSGIVLNEPVLEAETCCFTSRRFTRREKDCFMSKGIKHSPWEMLLLKLVIIHVVEDDGGEDNDGEDEDSSSTSKEFGCRSSSMSFGFTAKDTIQLENAVSTISQEYLLEFTFEYGIPASLHPELPGPTDPIVEFPEVKFGVYTKFFEFSSFRWMSFSKRPGKNTPQCYTKPFDLLKNWNHRFFWVDDRVFPTVTNWPTSGPKDQMPSVDMDLFSLISAPNPAKVKIKTCPRAAHEVPLLTATTNRVIDMEDITRASGSSGIPSTVEKSPLDFSNEDPPPLVTERIETEEQGQDESSQGISPVGNLPYIDVAPEPYLEKETVAMGALVNKRRRKKGPDEAEANAPPKVLRKDHVASHLSQSTLGGNHWLSWK
nr:hypothetical protein [Tanacetum cinerariifolium]